MAEVPKKEVGAVWIVGGLPQDKIPGLTQGPDLARELGVSKIQWSHLNERHGTIIEVKQMGSVTLYKVSFNGNRDAWVRFSANFLHTYVKPLSPTITGSKMRCCSPSVGMCKLCSTEFELEMMQSGRTYNRWTKTWEDPR